MMVASAIHAWKRPVTALSSIAPYSDTVDVLSGRVLHAPGGAHRTVDLRPGDRVVRYDGRMWQEAQRLNWHELSERRPGEMIELLVQRGPSLHPVSMLVTSPNWWEQLVLWRYPIGAGVCWLPASLILLTMTLDARRQSPHRHTLSVEHSSIPLWFLSWQAMSIAQSMGSLKYPIAVMWTEALVPVIALLMAAVSLPHPLAPRTRRSYQVELVLAAVATATATATIVHAFQSPFPSADWRRMVQLLRPSDLVWRWSYGVTVLGAAAALLGIIATASSEWLTKKLRWLSQHTPAPAATWIQGVADWIERLYQQCPTSINVIAQFQAIILLIYLGFDLLPRIQGGVGGGYSSLFPIIPLSYLLLYGDTQAQHQGRIGIWGIATGVAFMHILNGIPRLLNGPPEATGATWADIGSILLVALGTVGGGMGIAMHQFLRGRESSLTVAIDGLFHRTDQKDFWHHLTQVVGGWVGVSTWLWVRREDNGDWQPVEQAGQVRPEWLAAPGVQDGLGKLATLKPVDVIVDTLELPTTLILLPIARHERVYEVLIAANPQKARARRLREPNVAGRLREAVNLLRVREQEQERAEEQARYAEAMRRLQEWEKRGTQTDYMHAFALLHDGPLHQMAALAETMRKLEKQMGAPHGHAVSTFVGELEIISHATRHIFQNLGAAIVVERLVETVRERINEWEEQFPEITFRYEVTEEPSLSQGQRERVYLVVKQAVENAISHARPQTIRVTMRQDADGLKVEIGDDGCGFDYDAVRVQRRDGGGRSQTSHLSSGLLIMKKLVEEMGGTFTVETHPGQGCRVQVHL